MQTFGEISGIEKRKPLEVVQDSLPVAKTG